MSHTSIIYRVSSTDGPIRQCEIFSNLVHLIPRTEDPLTIDQITKPYVILVTQDCDLHNDYLARHDHYTDDLKRKAQLLPFLTFIELLPIGEIYSKYGISSSLAKKVKTNQHDRYQYFRIVSAGEDSMCEGMPEFVCDFRRSFSVPTDYIYRELSIGRLNMFLRGLRTILHESHCQNLIMLNK